MKKIIVNLLALFITFPITCFADANLEALLNRVTLQLRATQWITTKTALVNVQVNASVTDQGVEKVQTTVMEKLNSFSRRCCNNAS